MAAGNTLEAFELDSGSTITDPSAYVTILWVMTPGIAIGFIFVPFLTKKIQDGMTKIGTKDKNGVRSSTTLCSCE